MEAIIIPGKTTSSLSTRMRFDVEMLLVLVLLMVIVTPGAPPAALKAVCIIAIIYDHEYNDNLPQIVPPLTIDRTHFLILFTLLLLILIMVLLLILICSTPNK